MSEGFITNHKGDEVEPGQPRLIALQIDESANHFHKINYKKDLTMALQKTLTFGTPGLLTKVEYFEDNEKLIPVLTVEREYLIEESTGALQAKKTQRIYTCEDGSIHSEVKDGGWYAYTPGESREATHRRRVNIVNSLEADLVSLLRGLAGADQVALEANIASASALMSELSDEVNRFYLAGDPSGVIAKVEDAATQTQYPFLAAAIPGTGATGAQYIAAKLTY